MEKDTSEIAKLTERIAKDPKSKLFVPLAEEYKKAGDLEMAIQVLTEGLRSNPGYVTARSFLGRLLMDKGDLAGAQKELEEVIKAIPDNLLAQRKLGDLYALQGRSGDALLRYKAALALNPSDKELPSLLADLASGKDVSARIPQPKVMTSPAAPQAAPASVAPPKPKPVPSSGAAIPAGSTTGLPTAAQKAPTPPITVPKIDSAPAAPATPVAQPQAVPPPPPHSPPARDEAEIIEDIVEIEPLEQPGPAPEIKAPAVENAAVPVPEPAGQDAETAEMPAFDLSEIPEMASTENEDLTAVSWGTETFTPPEESRPAETATEGDEGGDDLNTNTLAELYISQGFYDKAIEIYHGMLEERPENKALQEKLERLRAMAGTAESGVEGFATEVPMKGEYTPSGPEAMAETQPAVQASTETLRAMNEVPLSPELSPSGTAPEKTVTESAPDSTDVRSPQAAMARRKETIDRLESWLKNIMKEKES
jgi:tetratricopeptide (TPR) repeat protein